MADIRDCHMWSMVAQMWAEVATMEGMKAANLVRERQGYAQAWPEEAFDEVANRLGGLSQRIEEVYR